jgi:hypothetical protein
MSAMSTHLEETRDFWNRVADDWHTQVGPYSVVFKLQKPPA